MAKTNEQYQQELAQLFIRSGETQFMVRMYRRAIEEENNKLNTINQKIENLQKAYRTFLAQSGITAPVPAPEVAEQPEQSQEGAADATPPTEAV